MLADLNRIFNEELAMQITSNKYTPLTVASLTADSASFDAWVKNFLESLVDEKKAKIEYEDRASKVVISIFTAC